MPRSFLNSSLAFFSSSSLSSRRWAPLVRPRTRSSWPSVANRDAVSLMRGHHGRFADPMQRALHDKDNPAPSRFPSGSVRGLGRARRRSSSVQVSIAASCLHSMLANGGDVRVIAISILE